MLKHFADTLDLLAQVTGNKGMRTAADRIQAMKFYQLANAFDSLLRVGLNLVDDFVWVNDFICARQVLAFGKVHLAKAAIPLPRSTAHDGLVH